MIQIHLVFSPDSAEADLSLSLSFFFFFFFSFSSAKPEADNSGELTWAKYS